MNWKEFLKPTLIKIIITIIIFTTFWFLLSLKIETYMVMASVVGSGTVNTGIPSQYCISQKIACVQGQVCYPNDPQYSNILCDSSLILIIIPILFVYLISCLVIFVYNKVKKK